MWWKRGKAPPKRRSGHGLAIMACSLGPPTTHKARKRRPRVCEGIICPPRAGAYKGGTLCTPPLHGARPDIPIHHVPTSQKARVVEPISVPPFGAQGSHHATSVANEDIGDEAQEKLQTPGRLVYHDRWVGRQRLERGVAGHGVDWLAWVYV